MIVSQPVLEIETDDVRPLARLLRGISFQQKANVSVSAAGLAVQVDDTKAMVAVAYISQSLFNRYVFTPRRRPRQRRFDSDPFVDKNDNPERLEEQIPSTPSRRQVAQPGLHTPYSGRNPQQGDSIVNGDNIDSDDDEEDLETYQFEINLTTLLECLNMYGHATTSTASSGNSAGMASSLGEAPVSAATRRKRFNADVSAEHDSGFSVGGKLPCTSLLMRWDGPGYPLQLDLVDDEPNSPVTTCRLNLLEPEEGYEEHFDQDAMLFHVIMKANWLREAISDLDSSCTIINIIAGPAMTLEERRLDEGKQVAGKADLTRQEGRKAREQSGIFRLEAKGDFGTTELDYPNDKDLMDVFVCKSPLSFSYKFGLFSMANRALHSSLKISLRIDNQGFMSLQMMMPSPAGKRLSGNEVGIIEFKLTPVENIVEM